MLAVETSEGVLVGSASWFTVQHSPSTACRAINIGISLFAEHRGHGYGSMAQRQLADYLFSTRLVEPVEAATDVDNQAERRALEKAGFSQEGVLRHAQYRRVGQWRDIVALQPSSRRLKDRRSEVDIHRARPHTASSKYRSRRAERAPENPSPVALAAAHLGITSTYPSGGCRTGWGGGSAHLRDR